MDQLPPWMTREWLEAAVRLAGAAVNANDGRCALIEEALLKAFGMADVLLKLLPPAPPACHPCASAHHGCTGTVATPGALCEACDAGI